MDGDPLILATLGALLLLGVATYLIGQRIPVPQVTLLILFGVAIGPAGFDLLPSQSREWYPLVSSTALLIVGFLVGGKLSRASFSTSGREIFWISVFEVLGVAVLVFGGLAALGVRPEIALLLAGMGPASDPVATMGVVQETRARGPFTDTLLGVVAIDDAWGLIVFSALLAVAASLTGKGAGESVLMEGARELGGALLIGVGLGAPAAYLTRYLRGGEPMQAEALGIVLVGGGLATWLDVSFLLTAMVLGAVIVNVARADEQPFRMIENIEWPFIILFFVLSGASLEVGHLGLIGGVGLGYIVLRCIGLIAGACFGAFLARSEALHGRWMGPAILSQAGVALGLALVAGNRIPEVKNIVLPIIIGSTVVFELVGPVFTRLALRRVGEVHDE